mgnify:CR=1 FL=1
MLKEKKLQYNALLKRVENAENFLINIDEMKMLGKATKDDRFYINSYIKLINMVNKSIAELNELLGRRLTKEEMMHGFK